MEKNLEIEKKYLLKDGVFKEQVLRDLLGDLGLKSPDLCLINHDTYYDDNNVLNNLGLNARERKVQDQTEYTLKIKVDSQKIDKREELNFVSLKEMVNYLKDNLGLPINNLRLKLKLITNRYLFYYQDKDALVEVSIDKVGIYYENEYWDSFFMIECELKRGNLEVLEKLDNIIRDNDYILSCNLSKKDISLEKINGEKNLIRKRTRL